MNQNSTANIAWLDDPSLATAELAEEVSVLAKLARQGAPIPPTLVLTNEIWQELNQQPRLKTLHQRLFADFDWSKSAQTPQLNQAIQRYADYLTQQCLAASRRTKLLGLLKEFTELNPEFGHGWLIKTFAGSTALPLSQIGPINKASQLLSAIIEAYAKSLQPALFQLNQPIELTLIIQPVLPLIASGRIALKQDQLIIEALSGELAPWLNHELATDQYIFDAESGQTISISVTDQPWQLSLKGENLVHQKLSTILSRQAKLDQVAAQELIGLWRLTNQKELYFGRDRHHKFWFLMSGLGASARLSDKSDRRLSSTASTPALLKGASLNPQKVSGLARVIRRPDQLSTVEPGEILIMNRCYLGLRDRLTDFKGIVIEGPIASPSLRQELIKSGLPVLYGANQATHLIKSGQLITLDSYSGELLAGKSRQDNQNVQASVQSVQQYTPLATRLLGLVSSSHLSAVLTAKDVAIDGLVLRLDSNYEPTTRLQQLIELSELWHGQPLYYQLNFSGLAIEALRAEFRLIKTARDNSRANNLHLIIAFPGDAESLSRILTIFDQVGLAENEHHDLCLAATTPSALLLAERSLANQQISQVMLEFESVERLILGQAETNEYNNQPLNEAVALALEHFIDVGRGQQKGTLVKLERLLDRLDLAKLLIELGAESLVLPLTEIPPARQLLASLEQQFLLEQARQTFKAVNTVK
ncbi:MAG: hypothetical protein CEO22_188 [Candidatus Berkelbacteria bacterium Gr01-1014_85]|uniref:Pyruvate, water dikinase n=1 Tax=Candidatus Berkelbacteria bacterium Gr01-1014_85 TaxID=2017150 RepID=A0A554JD26_9BACT|nr:MAG: hypothetical protein CEO22_188 [Candidatus Berkelbacteria bacterium Gr01-1014_85]